MTEPYKFPPRKWGDEPAPAVEVPTVVVSSREGAPVPPVAAAIRLEAAATAAGWTVRQTYAVAEVPGTSRRAAHQVATVCVRMDRSYVAGIGLTVREFAFAMWRNEDDRGSGWRFDHALVNGQPVGARSIVEALR